MSLCVDPPPGTQKITLNMLKRTVTHKSIKYRYLRLEIISSLSNYLNNVSEDKVKHNRLPTQGHALWIPKRLLQALTLISATQTG